MSWILFYFGSYWDSVYYNVNEGKVQFFQPKLEELSLVRGII